MNPSLQQRQDASIETLKGLACLTIVAYHVVGSTAQAGLGVLQDSFWRLSADSLPYFSLPVFAFLSGYLFNQVTSSWTDVGSFLKKKLLRLGIPLVVVSYLFYATSCVVDSPFCAVPLWKVAVYPYAHFWFLQSILIVIIFITLATFTLKSYPRLLILFALLISIVVILYGRGLPINLFGFNAALKLLPFFLLGHTLRVWQVIPYFVKNPIQRKVTISILGATMIILGSSLSSSDFSSIDVPAATLHTFSLLALTCFFLILLRLPIQPLSIIGFFSYTIYLFHPFFTSASRRLLLMVDPNTNTPILFFVGLLAGVSFPIILHYIAIRYHILSLLLLGIDTTSASQKPPQ